MAGAAASEAAAYLELSQSSRWQETTAMKEIAHA
jgi:hypothetical protein